MDIIQDSIDENEQVLLKWGITEKKSDVFNSLLILEAPLFI